MRTLKINLLYECTARCDHCRFGCDNRTAPQRPDFDTPLKVAAELKASRGLDLAVVLGGEPALFPRETRALLAELCALGLGTRLETNAGWAVTPEEAVAFLRPLAPLGTEVMLSLDAFHEPYVPVERVANAVNACAKLGLPFNLELPYLDVERKTHPLDARTGELFGRLQALTAVDIPRYEGGLLFIGRAARRFGDAFAAGRGVPEGPCTCVPWWADGEIDSDRLLILEPGGYLTKGCGIAIGNVHVEGVTRLLARYDAKTHPIFSVLLEKGPLGLARMAEAYGYRIKADYADKCHLCHEARQVLQPHFAQWLAPMQHYAWD